MELSTPGKAWALRTPDGYILFAARRTRHRLPPTAISRQYQAAHSSHTVRAAPRASQTCYSNWGDDHYTADLAIFRVIGALLAWMVLGVSTPLKAAQLQMQGLITTTCMWFPSMADLGDDQPGCYTAILRWHRATMPKDTFLRCSTSTATLYGNGKQMQVPYTLVGEAPYGTDRRTRRRQQRERSRSHSSSSDRRIGRMLMRTWDSRNWDDEAAHRRAFDSAPRRQAPTPAEHDAYWARQRLRRRMRQAAQRHRDSAEARAVEGPPVWWQGIRRARGRPSLESRLQASIPSARTTKSAPSHLGAR